MHKVHKILEQWILWSFLTISLYQPWYYSALQILNYQQVGGGRRRARGRWLVGDFNTNADLHCGVDYHSGRPCMIYWPSVMFVLVKYRTDIFSTNRASAATEVRAEKRRYSVRYFTSTDRTREINKYSFLYDQKSRECSVKTQQGVCHHPTCKRK